MTTSFTMNQRLTGYEAYKIYVGISSHFNSGRDFLKYGVPNIKVETFYARKDRYYFERLAKDYRTKDELIHFLLVAFLKNPKFWVGDLKNTDYATAARMNQRFRESDYEFKKDLDAIFSYANDPVRLKTFLTPVDGQPPELLKWLWEKKIKTETFMILDLLFNISKSYNELLTDDIMWANEGKRFGRYLAAAKWIHENKEAWRRIVAEKAREHRDAK